jgi:hypothetical protein
LAQVARLLVKAVALKSTIIADVDQLASKKDLTETALSIYRGFSAEFGAPFQLVDEHAKALVAFLGDDPAYLTEAFSCATRATEGTRNKNPFYLHTMATVFSKMGEYAKARETERKAISRLSDIKEDSWEHGSSLRAGWLRKLTEYERQAP